MLDFHKPVMEDKEWAAPLLRASGYMGCEYTFGNMFLWCGVFGTKVARFQDFALAISNEERRATYCMPAGIGDRKAAIEAIMADAKRRGIPFIMHGVTPEGIRYLDEVFPGKFTYEASRDDFDYIYSAESLAGLSGKKYHGKRNHISYFKKNFNWQYERITPDNLEECRRMNEEWERLNSERKPEEIATEMRAVNHALNHFEELGFIGGLLRTEEGVVAYTIGEPINDSCFCTHIEKAFASVRGAYPMINQQFAINELTQYRYINREEDTGDEGLRKAKLSYYPEILLEKHLAYYRDDCE